MSTLAVEQTPAEFGAPASFQQQSRTKWKITIGGGWFLYLGAPAHVRSEAASQAEVAASLPKIRELCSEIVRDIPNLVRLKLYYERLSIYSFVSHFPREPVLKVKTESSVFSGTRNLTTAERPPTSVELVRQVSEMLPQYDVTLRTERLELDWFETVAKSWDNRHSEMDDPRNSWDVEWKSGLWENQPHAKPLSTVDDMPAEFKKGYAGDGYIVLVDPTTDEKSSTALYFSGIEVMQNTVHQGMSVITFMGYNGYHSLASVILIMHGDRKVCIDVRASGRKTWNGSTATSYTWKRYAGDLLDVQMYYNSSPSRLYSLKTSGTSDFCNDFREKEERFGETVAKAVFAFLPTTIPIAAAAGILAAANVAAIKLKKAQSLRRR